MSEQPAKPREKHGEFRPLGRPITPFLAGGRVDALLGQEFRFLSRSQWQKRVAQGLVLVNDRPVATSYRLRANDQLSMYYVYDAEPDVDRGLRCLWQDRGVMAVFKPGRLPMHENGAYRQNTFSHLVQEIFGKEWSAVHRLDRETSGIVLCGASLKIRQALAQDLADKKMVKRYLAIAFGHPPEDAWRVDAPIGEPAESSIRIKKWVDPEGLPAVTDFEVLERAEAASLLRATPRTGRTNQIRVHAAYSGFPLVGDKMYHPDEDVFLDYFHNGDSPAVHARTGFRRHALHAEYLCFRHPETGTLNDVQCPLPEDLVGLWTELVAPAERYPAEPIL